MELDDFKQQNSNGQIPEIDLNAREDETIQSLVEEVKTKDAAAIKAILILLLTFGGLGLIYLTSIARNTGATKAGYALLALGFILIELFFFFKYTRQKKVDYSAPALTFLKKAEQRYTYWSLTDKIAGVPMLIVMCVGGGLIVYGSFQKYFPGSWIPLLVYIAVILAATGVGTWAGRKQWVKNNKEIYDRIRKMRQEFEK